MAVTGGKSAAQQRVDRIRAFRRELEQLTAEGAIELAAEQRERLDRHLAATLAALARDYDVDTTESQKQISWGMRIASALGGLALCAAVVLFFYRFWGVLPTWVQVALLVATPILLAFAADRVARRERTLYYTMLLSLVAFAAFVLDLNVLAAIFNVTPTPKGLLAWSAFALLLAYRHGLRFLLAAGLVCAIGWFAAVLTAATGYYWAAFMERPETVAIAGLLAFVMPWRVPHPRRSEFPGVYALVGLLGMFIPVLLLANFGPGSYLPFADRTIEILYQLTGMAGGAGVIWWGIRTQVAGIVNLGAVFFALFLFVRLFHWWWDWKPKYLFFLILGAIAIALVALFKRLRAKLLEAA